MADLKPAYLLTGSDRPKLTRAVRRLRDRVGDDATEVVSALDASGDDVVAACNALGLFAVERRLVLVEDVDRWKAPDAKAVAAYLAAPAATTVLALVADELKADAPLAKAVADVGEILVYDLPKRGSKADLAGWAARQFEAHGLKVDAQACRLLVRLVGESVEELGTEVDKLATWAAGEPITEREIELLVAPRAEATPFALTDSWGRRDVRGVIRASEHLLDRASESPRDALPRIVGMLVSHVDRVAECQTLSDDGVTPKQAAERMKKNRYYVEKLYEQAANFTPDELRDATVRLARLDHALKGGSRLAGELEFDRALVEITRPREPAPV
jgi:DNA polymerase-3 subunit delta